MKRRSIRKTIKRFETWSGCDAEKVVPHDDRHGLVDHFKRFRRIHRVARELKNDFYCAMEYYYSRYCG